MVRGSMPQTLLISTDNDTLRKPEERQDCNKTVRSNHILERLHPRPYSQDVVHAATTDLRPAPPAAEDEDPKKAAALIAPPAVDDSLEVVVAVAIVILTNHFKHEIDISTSLSLSDLAASSEQTVLVEVRACTCPPAIAADEAELRSADASVESVSKRSRS